jgi:hypothetical protein
MNPFGARAPGQCHNPEDSRVAKYDVTLSLPQIPELKYVVVALGIHEMRVVAAAMHE